MRLEEEEKQRQAIIGECRSIEDEEQDVKQQVRRMLEKVADVQGALAYEKKKLEGELH